MAQPYITFREDNEDGKLCYYVLGRTFPHFIGRVETRVPQSTVAQASISGYNMWIVFDYTLRGKFIPSYANIAEEIQATLELMAVWFLDNRIINNERKYLKFKITTK